MRFLTKNVFDSILKTITTSISKYCLTKYKGCLHFIIFIRSRLFEQIMSQLPFLPPLVLTFPPQHPPIGIQTILFFLQKTENFDQENKQTNNKSSPLFLFHQIQFPSLIPSYATEHLFQPSLILYHHYWITNLSLLISLHTIIALARLPNPAGIPWVSTSHFDLKKRQINSKCSPLPPFLHVQSPVSSSVLQQTYFSLSSHPDPIPITF